VLDAWPLNLEIEHVKRALAIDPCYAPAMASGTYFYAL
jgi:hypothetical protein